MRKFKFEIELEEADLEGDEFWEKAIEKDGTGISELTSAIVSAIEDSNLVVSSERDVREMIKLTHYSDND